MEIEELAIGAVGAAGRPRTAPVVGDIDALRGGSKNLSFHFEDVAELAVARGIGATRCPGDASVFGTLNVVLLSVDAEKLVM